MDTPVAGYTTASEADAGSTAGRDARLTRLAAALFPAGWCYAGTWYAFGLLADGWRVLEGGAALRTLGGLMAAVEAMTAAALVFSIVGARQWRWRALAGWAISCLLCAALFGIFGILPEGMSRARLLMTSLAGTGVTVTLVARTLVVLKRRAA